MKCVTIKLQKRAIYVGTQKLHKIISVKLVIKKRRKRTITKHKHVIHEAIKEKFEACDQDAA